MIEEAKESDHIIVEKNESVDIEKSDEPGLSFVESS